MPEKQKEVVSQHEEVIDIPKIDITDIGVTHSNKPLTPFIQGTSTANKPDKKTGEVSINNTLAGGLNIGGEGLSFDLFGATNTKDTHLAGVNVSSRFKMADLGYDSFRGRKFVNDSGVYGKLNATAAKGVAGDKEVSIYGGKAALDFQVSKGTHIEPSVKVAQWSVGEQELPLSKSIGLDVNHKVTFGKIYRDCGHGGCVSKPRSSATFGIKGDASLAKNSDGKANITPTAGVYVKIGF